MQIAILCIPPSGKQQLGLQQKSKLQSQSDVKQPGSNIYLTQQVAQLSQRDRVTP